MQIAEMLMDEGLLNNMQLNEALKIREVNPHKKIGEILLELDYIDIDKFTMLIDRQLRENGMTR